jgi:hypothetical protein
MHDAIFSKTNNVLNTQLHHLKSIKLDNVFAVNVQHLHECNKKVNKLLHSKNNSVDDSTNTKFISISTSNFSSVYITANKITNTIVVSFRGTYSLKSSLSYSKLTSVAPFKICSKDQGVLLGVFKIVYEIFNTIIESINYLSSHFLNSSGPIIITTGHSLGGACSTIFSYLYYLNIKQRIVCITFGSPRVFNGALIIEYDRLITENKVFFMRYVTNGDPFAKLPPNLKNVSNKNTFFHPDDFNNQLDYTSITCKNGTRKITCNLKSKTKKRAINFKYHGVYLGISYKGAAENLTDLKKEIKRNQSGDTICRIIIGGDNHKLVATFYNLQELKYKDYANISQNAKVAQKIKKLIITDYTHHDIYMNEKQFLHILNNASEMNDANPLTTANYTSLLNINTAKKGHICF